MRVRLPPPAHPALGKAAAADLVERTRYYRHEGDDQLGERFFGAAIAALDAIGRVPGAGSPRVGELCGVPGLRFRSVAGFPCGWSTSSRLLTSTSCGSSPKLRTCPHSSAIPSTSSAANVPIMSERPAHPRGRPGFYECFGVAGPAAG